MTPNPFGGRINIDAGAPLNGPILRPPPHISGALTPDVIGAIRDKWVALGGEDGFGRALDVERSTFDGRGRSQSFSGGGTISWHPDLGAFAVRGAIAAKWLALGREQYGYPMTDEMPCPDGRGRFNHFRTMQLADRPTASIYWTAETGAHEVRGSIRTAWSSRGFERSKLGYPTSDQIPVSGPNGAQRSNFEHGSIDWTADHGVQVDEPVPFDE
jgi:uncharacterized protein with LGFP repeats